MARTLRLSYEFVQAAMQSQGVRDALRAKAEQIRSRADGIAAAEDVDMEVTVESGTRPQGRPYSNVVGDNVDQEWGTSKTGRRRILGRAAEGA